MVDHEEKVDERVLLVNSGRGLLRPRHTSLEHHITQEHRKAVTLHWNQSHEFIGYPVSWTGTGGQSDRG